MAMRISSQKLLEHLSSASHIIEVVFIDLTDGQQRFEPKPAARIFATQELILLDRRAQDGIVIESVSHFDREFSRRRNARGRFTGGRSAKIDTPVSIHYALVLAARPL